VTLPVPELLAGAVAPLDSPLLDELPDELDDFDELPCELELDEEC